jgi:hypothetical protein
VATFTGSGVCKSFGSLVGVVAFLSGFVTFLAMAALMLQSGVKRLPKPLLQALWFVFSFPLGLSSPSPATLFCATGDGRRLPQATVDLTGPLPSSLLCSVNCHTSSRSFASEIFPTAPVLPRSYSHTWRGGPPFREKAMVVF